MGKWCLLSIAYTEVTFVDVSEWNRIRMTLRPFCCFLTPSLSPSVSHNDLALQLRRLHDNRLSQIDLRNVSKVATDITRLQAGRVQAQVI